MSIRPQKQASAKAAQYTFDRGLLVALVRYKNYTCVFAYVEGFSNFGQMYILVPHKVQNSLLIWIA